MTDLSDFIALSLLPISWGVDIAERLRAGRRPGDVFDHLVRERWPNQPDRRAGIAARIARAIDLAARSRITPISWADTRYPPALAAIVDPPPLLWLRGAASALADGLAVAIVGSRAPTPYGLEVAGQLAADLASRAVTIVSGLCRATVVIEAGKTSGSLITARCALDQGRDVLAVPGSVLTGRNRGGHGLLRDGAKIVESADDILEELGLFANHAARFDASSGHADPVLACLPVGEPCDLDTISERSGLNSARLLPRLLELELQGLVRRAGGGRFVRFDRSC